MIFTTGQFLDDFSDFFHMILNLFSILSKTLINLSDQYRMLLADWVTFSELFKICWDFLVFLIQIAWTYWLPQELWIHASFLNNTFITASRLKFGKKWSKSWAICCGWTFAIWKIFAFLVSSKNNRKYSLKCLKRTSVPVFVKLYN